MNSTRNDADQAKKGSENSTSDKRAVSVPVSDEGGTGTEPVPHGDDASTLQADASGLNLKTDTRQANWRRANPEKYLAHVAVQRALSSGELVKGACEVCGDPAVDGHHDDYSKPLEVRWLCRQHHIRLHGGGEDLFACDSHPTDPVTEQRQERE